MILEITRHRHTFGRFAYTVTGWNNNRPDAYTYIINNEVDDWDNVKRRIKNQLGVKLNSFSSLNPEKNKLGYETARVTTPEKDCIVSACWNKQ